MVNILDRFLFQKLAGVQIDLTNEGHQIRALLCQRKGNELLIVEQWEKVESIAVLAELLGALPAVIVLTGKGVIWQQDIDTEQSWPDLLQARLPGAKAKDFAGEINEEMQLLSITRIQLIQDVVAKLKTEGLSIVGLLLGASSLTVIEELLPSMTINNAPFQFEKQDEKWKLTSIAEQTTTTVLDLNGQSLSSNLVLAFAAVVSQLTATTNRSFNLLDTYTQSAQDYRQNQYTRYVGLGGLGILLLALLINFFAFSQLTQKSTAAEGELYYSQNLISTLDSLQKQLEQRQAVLGKSGPVPASIHAKLADELAASLPDGIQLKGLTVFPAEKNTNQRDRNTLPSYDNHSIVVKGQSTSSRSLDEWIQDLERLEWIEAVLLQPYLSGQKDRGSFEVVVSLKKPSSLVE